MAKITKEFYPNSVTDDFDNSVKDIVQGTTTVGVVKGHELAGDTSLSGNPGDTVTYHFTILNTGNAQEKMFYTVSSSWSIDNVGGDTTLEMGESDTISVTQTIPSNSVASALDSSIAATVSG